jgi:hypothetical protein
LIYRLSGWWIVPQASETKEKRPDEREVDHCLTSWIERYLSIYRPVLALPSALGFTVCGKVNVPAPKFLITFPSADNSQIGDPFVPGRSITRAGAVHHPDVVAAVDIDVVGRRPMSRHLLPAAYRGWGHRSRGNSLTVRSPLPHADLTRLKGVPSWAEAELWEAGQVAM